MPASSLKKKMDTPPRNMINTPVSDSEKSPLYKYIDNLSPLKPVKPAHIPHTFNSIGCSSPPYVFTSSPHVNGLKESRFVQRNDDPVETKKRRLSYEDVNRICSGEETLADSSTHTINNSTDQGISVGDASLIDLTGEDRELIVGQPQGSDYHYFGCPVNYPPLCDDEANSLLPLPGETASDVANVPDGHETNSVEGEPHLQGMCQMEPKSEGQEDDCDSFITDATDLLSFNPPDEAEMFRPSMLNQMEDSGQVVDYMSLIIQSLVNDGRRVDSPLSHFDRTQDNTNVALMTDNANEKVDNEHGEDFNLISPNPQRRRCNKLEPAEVTEGCKGCNCKKSKCLKLYCKCFAAGVYCTAPCSCENCFNQPVYEDRVRQTCKQIEIRNPLAFAPKVIRSSDSADEIGSDPNKIPAPARHKRGCNCKKSSCSKKYCDCYQSGVGCSMTCRCEGCKNTYGRKNGSAP